MAALNGITNVKRTIIVGPTLHGPDGEVPEAWQEDEQMNWYLQLNKEVCSQFKHSLHVDTRSIFQVNYIYNFHVLSNLLLIYICKLHWNLNTMFVCQVISF